MPTHHVFAWLPMFTVPPVAGLTLFILMRRTGHGLLSLLLALFAMALTFVFVLTLSIRCTDSIAARLAAPRLLTPSELLGLRGANVLCPDAYLFDRDGHRECLVADGDGGARVGCG